MSKPRFRRVPWYAIPGEVHDQLRASKRPRGWLQIVHVDPASKVPAVFAMNMRDEWYISLQPVNQYAPQA